MSSDQQAKLHIPNELALSIVLLQKALDNFMESAQAYGYGDTRFWEHAAQASVMVHIMMSRYAPRDTEDEPQAQ